MCAREKTINMTSKYKSSTEYHIKLSNTIGSELRIGLPKSGLLKRFKRLNKINNTEIKSHVCKLQCEHLCGAKVLIFIAWENIQLGLCHYNYYPQRSIQGGQLRAKKMKFSTRSVHKHTVKGEL